MKIQVFDTWVEKSDGEEMHFDVFMPEGKTNDDAIASAKEYLKSKGHENATVTSKECSFCHVQDAKPDQEKEISEKGYFIYEMSGCN